MCIEKYIELYKSNNTKDWELSISLEKVGTDFIKCLQNGNDIDSDAALDFINKVETWKAMGIKKRIKGVGKNTSPQALQAITNVFNNQENKKKIEALHTLSGFGISQHKDYGTKPAKVATAAMRFLYPEEWGVVDWRSGTIAKCLVDSSDICEAINLAQKKKKRYWKDSFSHINSE
jgi:hypothetical protein